jgi:hypothetical protein
LLILALATGANAAVFSLVNALVLQPRPGRIDSAVGVFSRDRVKNTSYRDFSYPAYVDLRDRSGVFESLMAHTFSIVGIGDGDATRQAFVAVVSSNYFTTLGVPLAAGRSFTPDEERPGARAPVAIASFSLWRNAVRRLVLREGMGTTAVGLAIGLLLAAGLGKLLSGLLYRVSPFDPAVLMVAAIVLSTSAMLACYFPARRATRVVPLEALRAE